MEEAPTGGGGVAGSSRPAPTLTADYEDGGSDSIVQIRQFNELSDIDIALEKPEAGVPDFITTDVTATVGEILADLANLTPNGMQLGQWSASAFADLTAARHASLAADYPDGLSPSIDGGLYIDGVLQAEGTARPELPNLEPLAPSTPQFGLSAETGGNAAVNAAMIVDTSTFRGGMIVLGDYFETNAIVQANVLHDDDHVTWGGSAPGTGLERSSGDNLVTNIASFEDKSFGFSTDGLRTGLNWKVDVVRGDLFDVHMVEQRNVITDNDITVQSRFTSYYELRTGDNQSVNLTELFQGGPHYDLIVIGGNYHEANLIFQTNILLDGDYLWSVAGGDGENGLGYRSGFNTLRNDASITHVGDYDFRSLDAPASHLADAIANESLDLATIRAAGVPGNGTGTFNVLYIEGNYFNLNLVSQINVIADLDTAIQVIRGADGATGTLSTGANQLFNAAGIVQVGSSSSYNYIGGGHYEDSVLVQTNIISDQNEVVYANVNDLAPEIIAFLGDVDPQAEHYHPQAPVTLDHSDVMGGVLS